MKHLSLFAALLGALPGYANPADFSNSAFWPNRVSLVNELSVVADGREVTLAPGWEAILLRVEDGKILADFGRHGIHTLEPEKTDFNERVEALRSGKSSKDLPNLVRMIGDKCARWTGEGVEIKRSRMEDFTDRKIIVFLHVNPNQPDSLAVARSLQEPYRRWMDEGRPVEIIMISTHADLAPIYAENAPTWLAILPGLMSSYRQVLSHPVENPPAIVVSDVEGKLLQSFDGVTVDQLPELESKVEAFF